MGDLERRCGDKGIEVHLREWIPFMGLIFYYERLDAEMKIHSRDLAGFKEKAYDFGMSMYHVPPIGLGLWYLIDRLFR